MALSHEHTHTSVRGVLHTDVLTTSPDIAASRAVALMLASHVPFLPVVDSNRRIVGILTLREVLSAFFFPNGRGAAGHS